jgi:phenylalanyl-tRNA synthetase beta chain
MRYSLNRLQSYIQDLLPEVDILKEKIIFSAFEVESIEQIGSDTVLDIKVLPDRASDCFSHRGMARELARICGLRIFHEEKSVRICEVHEDVIIVSGAVSAYTLIRMKTQKQKDTPRWMKDYLTSLGQRSISLFVDIANTVMFDLGQPVHIFDAKKVVGGIAVRESINQETITLLTGETIILPKGVLIIADHEGPLAIAGIKGGKRAEVDEHTEEVLIEVANFDPSIIRKTTRMLRLHTDASKRFENTVPLSYTKDGVQASIAHIETLVGGEIISMFSYTKEEVVQKEISFTTADITRLLGVWVTDSLVKDVLARTGWEYTEKADFYTVLVPLDRPDIKGVHDIAEDIGKLAGYEHAGSIETLPFELPIVHDDVYTQSQSVRAYFIENGYSEVYNYTFTKKGKVEIAYGPKDRSALRTNLLDGLVLSYEKNKKNAPLLMTDTVRIFEIGTVFLGEPEESVSTEGFGASNEEMRVAWKSQNDSGEMTLLEFIEKKENIIHDLIVPDISKRTPFKDWSVYPYIVRDVAVWVLEKEKEEILEMIAQNFAKEYCAVPARVFDRFEKEGKVSVAYRFVFQSYEKTLTDEEVEGYMNHLVEKLDPSIYILR